MKHTINVRDELAFARRQLARAVPYFSAALFRLGFVESEELPTFAVDAAWRVYYNPTFAKEAVAEGSLEGCVLHECEHVVMRHGTRAKTIHATDAERWNVAADLEGNQRILEIRPAVNVQVKLPTVGLRPERGRERWTAEEHYHHDEQEKQSGGAQGQPQPGTGAGKPGGGKPQPSKNPCSGGSGVTGQKAPWEKTDAPGGVAEAEAEIVRAQVAQAIKEYAQANGRGSVPAGYLRWAEEYGEAAPVDWGSLLTSRVAYQLTLRKGPAPTYARPSRRQSGGGLILPTYRQPQARVTIVGDTSGSMGDEDIGVIVATVYEAVEALGEVTAIGCDAAASDATDVRHIEDLREALRGGGGTNMIEGLAVAEETSADVIVVITDGETPWPSEEPATPVVVVLTRKGNTSPPEWADTIIAA